jgi:hypothetical protein
VADHPARQELGRIVLLQIQRASLKVGVRPHAYYDPAPLICMDRLLLEPVGCVGVTSSGERIVDVHHAQHPRTKNQRGLNGVSIGFTSHYQDMRAQFGAHLSNGIAGENILIETDRRLTLDDLGGEIAIQRGHHVIARLVDLLVAAPCVEFSQFAAGQGERLPAEALKSALQFLEDGMRGFYARLADEQPEVEVRVGDRILIR